MMLRLKIQTGSDNPILRLGSKEVVEIGGAGGAGAAGGGGNGRLAATGLQFGSFVKGMRKTLADQKGLGLAAPQVGENVRVILCRMDAGSDREVLFVMVNPEIVEMSASTEELAAVNGHKGRAGEDGGDDSVPFGIEVGEEGCLSLPGQYVQVARAVSIVVRFKDGRGFLKGGGRGLGGRDGRAKKASDLGGVELGLHGMNARVVQHEVDHLNGVLICDKAGG